VLLVSMPFHALERPSLGLSLLKAELRRRGVGAEVRYLGFTFAEFVGYEDYLWVHGELPYTAFAGDWTFTESLHGRRPAVDAEYVDRILHRTWRRTDRDVARLARIRAYCGHFLDHCMTAVPWGAYDVVGFTSTFEQNIASLALARRIRAAHPEVGIVFGGANWEGEMGEALCEAFPFVDACCSGEADRSFPELVACLAEGGDPAAIPGLVVRAGDRVVATGAPRAAPALDESPFPDYDDYLHQQQESPAAAHVVPTLMLETSRGCWWGAKHHCTFCGLNGGSMAFRSKGPDRALEEIRHLRDRYGAASLAVVDNILDMGYFSTLFPRLIDEGLEMDLFYEVKANLRHDQIATLWAAGVRRIQPGIESLSDHVLELMRKGTTALQNVQLLKWCRELGVRPEWNLLYGFPGETPADYRGMLQLVDAIDFLDPPSAYGPVRLDRFSPYHSDPAAHGIVDVTPMGPYRYLYPVEEDALRRIAYYFDFAYEDGRDPLDYARDLLLRVERWMAEGPSGGLWLVDSGEGLTVMDERRGAGRRGVALDGWRADTYRLCDRVHTRDRVLRSVGGTAPDEVVGFLDDCVRERWMARDGDRYLSLAVSATPRREPLPRPARVAAAAA
jgi:ribosomal peptide maturation radical SAM protein 1